MKLSAPKKITWLIAVVVGAAGLAGKLVPIAALAPNAFWLVTAGFAILVLGTLLDGV